MMNLELHLRIVGLLLLVLVALNMYVPRWFNWKGELASLSLLNRQIFQVHAAFICVILTMFATLALFYARELLEPTPLSRAVLAALTMFWFLRLLAQWFVYDGRLWRVAGDLKRSCTLSSRACGPISRRHSHARSWRLEACSGGQAPMRVTR